MSLALKVVMAWVLVGVAFNGCRPGAQGAREALSWGLLLPRNEAWLGADGAISVPLGDDSRLWLFGDTWIRSGDGSLKLVSNSLGFQKGECSDPFEPFWAEGPSAAMGSDRGQGWLWPAGGILLEEGLFLILHHMERTGPGPWDFRAAGSELIRIPRPRAPPSGWEPERVRLPWPGEDLLVAASPLVEGHHVLIFATSSSGGQRRLVLARLPRTAFTGLRVEQGWEFWGWGGTWTPLLTQAEPLVEGVGTELTVTRDPAGEGWICLYSPGGISPQVVLRKAAFPQGPWGAPLTLYSCPEAGSQGFYCYGAKLHPECASDGLWVTYSVNSRGAGFPGKDMARPRWLLFASP